MIRLCYLSLVLASFCVLSEASPSFTTSNAASFSAASASETKADNHSITTSNSQSTAFETSSSTSITLPSTSFNSSEPLAQNNTLNAPAAANNTATDITSNFTTPVETNNTNSTSKCSHTNTTAAPTYVDPIIETVSDTNSSHPDGYYQALTNEDEITPSDVVINNSTDTNLSTKSKRSIDPANEEPESGHYVTVINGEESSHNGSTVTNFTYVESSEFNNLQNSNHTSGANSTIISGKSKPNKNGKKVAAYYPSYNAELKPLSSVNYDLFDELIFFVATTNSNYTIGTGDLNQTYWDSLATEFVTRCKNASVTPTLAFGGWTGSIHFSDLVYTAENRTAFAHSMVDFTRQYGFEGIDLDWEWPSVQGIGCNVVRDEDVTNFNLFVQNLRDLWPEAQLSAAISIAGIRDSSYSPVPAANVTSLVKNLDQVHMMAYDVYGSWTDTTGPLAPFDDQCADDVNKLSVLTSYNVLLKQGFNASQLILGIPAYARSYTLTSPTLVPKTVGNYTTYYYQQFSPTIPAGGVADDKPGVDVCGQAVGNGGTWLTSELIANGFLSESQEEGLNGYTRYFDECSGVPFLASNTTFISYDDTQSTLKKTQWAKDSGLAGVYFFDAAGTVDKTVSAARNALLKD